MIASAEVVVLNARAVDVPLERLISMVDEVAIADMRLTSTMTLVPIDSYINRGTTIDVQHEGDGDKPLWVSVSNVCKPSLIAKTIY